ncbi:MAG: S8 family serine peptidase [Chloroflexus sp.]
MKRHLLSFLLIIAHLVSLLTLIPATLVHADPATFNASPSSITATVELGSVATIDITITNTGPSTLTPIIYTGFPSTTTLAMMAAPSSLPVPLPQQTERIDPDLQSELAHGRSRFLVFFADRPDLGPALQIQDWEARGEYVYRTLTEHATRSQRAVRAILDRAGIRYQVLWIANALLVEGDTNLASLLAAHNDVAMLTADQELQMTLPATTTTLPCNPINNVCWNIARIGADRVWREFGIDGTGITVANIDSGVTYTHTALVNSYRGNLGSSFDHNYNWFDPLYNTPFPGDAGIHGTHVMGIMVAKPPDQPAVGVAPGAKWIAARACNSTNCSLSSLMSAAQWMLAPTDLNGNNPRPALRPHVINNSWVFGTGGDLSYTGYTTAWEAAGIFPVFAAGNPGNTTCSTIRSPGDYANVVAVGATDQSDQLTSFSAIGPTTDGRIKPDLVAPGQAIISTVSSNSYQALSGTSMAAPHVAGAVALLWSANPQLIGNYQATYELLTGYALRIMNDSRYMGSSHTNCRPTTAINNIYGYGRLDVFAAVAAARVNIPWLVLPTTSPVTLASSNSQTITITLDARKVAGPGVYQARLLIYGNNLTDPPLTIPVTMNVPTRASHATISGTITDSETGLPLRGKITTIHDLVITTNSVGAYQLTVPGGSPQTLTASANGFVNQSQSVTPTAGSTITLNFALDPSRPRLTVLQDLITATVDFNQTINLAVPLRNDGNLPLSYTLTIDNEPYGVWRSDEPDGPTGGWINPPFDRQVLNLNDDGNSSAINLGFDFFFDTDYHRTIYINANGIIAFAPFNQPINYFNPSCLPLTETSAPAIVPLHVDFDSSAGGEISFARVSAGALITWDNVPIYNTSRRLSVQALLQPNGVIRFHYRNVAELLEIDQWAIGLQFNGQHQTIGCAYSGNWPFNLSDGLTVELRPQINPQVWLSVTGSSSTTLASGATVNVPLAARWIGPISGTLQARLRIESNDPLQPVATVRVQLNEGTPAPYQVIFAVIYR